MKRRNETIQKFEENLQDEERKDREYCRGKICQIAKWSGVWDEMKSKIHSGKNFHFFERELWAYINRIFHSNDKSKDFFPTLFPPVKG